jgi:uncharacterized protein YcbX
VIAKEPARLALYNRLGEVLGAENAETLMAGLPQQPAVELATKADIADLRAEIREIHEALRMQTNIVIAAMTALTGIFSAIVAVIT